MNNKKLLVSVLFVSLLTFFFGIFLISNSNPTTLTHVDDAHMEFMGERNHHWGDIDIHGGTVEKTFKIKNTGEDDLEINNFKTSCMCTEVEVIINGEQSPVFGMHSLSGWKGVIKSGEEANIHIVFDPMYHGPQAVGPITRLISFETNDSENSTVELTLTGEVINK